jgi:hypothetical protein
MILLNRDQYSEKNHVCQKAQQGSIGTSFLFDLVSDRDRSGKYGQRPIPAICGEPLDDQVGLSVTIPTKTKKVKP